LLDWAILAALALIWGTAFLLTSVALGAVPPATLVALRLAIAAVMLALGVLLTRRRFPTAARVWLHFLVLGILGNAAPFFLVSWGQQRIASGLAGILMAVVPLATLVLAHFFVPGDRMTPARAGGFVLGFAGVVLLIGPDAVREFGGGRTEILSQLAVLASALCWAANAIVARKLPAMDATVAAAGTLITGVAVMVPLAIVREHPYEMTMSPAPLLATIGLGVFSTAVGDVLYFRLIASAGPAFFSLVNYLIPVVAVAAGVIVLGEVLPATALVALACILAGLALGQDGRYTASLEDR
jgi:drug/metabolite transporter (DMT)-like permease